MVFYFKARPEVGDYTIFMGIDKHENEDLIKYGFPEDIWFHVDKMSSAHVYVRLNKGQAIDNISEGLLEDCAQLVKANSIQGNKVNNVDVVYTPWYNLKKTASMDVGQVGFHNSKMVRTVRVEKRINEIVNRLNKTKVERKPDLKGKFDDLKLWNLDGVIVVNLAFIHIYIFIICSPAIFGLDVSLNSLD
ncbi:hypothetical protein AQUCO_00100442v1 [Aquilegia coerulea]|uniref:NFACT RNA-binding domain-containing protein n=1 Tax=Aquilegia coerulea TaxID=218851 RepID=A0A2G5FAB4_AQUCA|nr:hypothetical protein AQUCO_00100442v1 [Aquilegia coerulea]